jgi:hypothetical protein
MNGNLRSLWFLIDKSNLLVTLIVLIILMKIRLKKNMKKTTKRDKVNIILKQVYKMISYRNRWIKITVITHSSKLE